MRGGRCSIITFVRPLTLTLIACAVSTPVDPRWSTAHPLPEPLQEMHGAVLDGQVYIAGGFDRSGQPTARAYRYHTASDTWERIADLPAPRHHMPLVVAYDTLYAVGGLSDTDFRAEATLWAYRVDRNAWEVRAPLPTPRASLPTARHGLAVAAVNGKIYVIGGGPRAGLAQTDVVEVFTP
jgi:N-acetylneuraminic acid mutarotase